MGVRQGENLSPLLFSLFINDMDSYSDTNGIPSLKLNDPIFDTLFQIQLLFYADDTVLLADNQTNLQNALTCLADYCADWKLEVNTEKINIVFFSKRKSRNPYVFYFNGCIDLFKYLGTIFNYNGSFVMHKEPIDAQAQKAMFSVLKRSRELESPIDLQLELFESLVLPILLYDCEIWGFENIEIVEKLHPNFFLNIFFA